MTNKNPKSDSPLTVRELRVENYKRVEAVTIAPDGSPLVLLNGNNDQGKSSTLEAMLAALIGKPAFAKEPVRQGAKNARIRVELAGKDGKVALTVERLIRPDGSHALKLSSADPNIRQEQATLNRLLGQVAFDPFAFSDMKPAERRAALLEAAGVDVSGLDRAKKNAYEERTAVGRNVSRLEALVAGGPAATPIGKRDEIDTTALLDDLAALNEQVAALNKRIREAQDHNRWVADQRAHNAAHAANVDRLELERADYAALTEQLAKYEQEKADTLAAAKMPVAGLEIGDEDVLFRGVPLEQAGDGTRLKVSTALGFALNPDIRIALIRQGSLLDEAALADVAQVARDAGGQCWVERVGKDGPVGFVIEAGRVLAEQEAK